MNRKDVLSCFCLCLFLPLSHAADYDSFPGQYLMGGEHLIDSDSKGQNNTHIYFQLGGQAARDLYFSINEEPMINPCIDDGTLTKSSGNIQCDFSPSSNTYGCYFGLGIHNNQTVPGAVC